ncbi:MAG: YfdX family protein [Woeseiaceae bacterium]
MITRTRSNILKLTIASILATGMVNTQSAIIGDLKENVNITSTRTVSPAEERIMSRSAARVLRYIADARSAINAKNIDDAKIDLKQARSLIAIIKSQMPTAVVRDHISVAKQHLNYESTDEVIADLVPIEADLNEIENFIPVEKAKKHLQSTHAHLKKGDKTGAKKELEAIDVALIYTEVDLPLSATERQVITAQKALKNNNLPEADKALKMAENGVQFLSSAVEAPVTQARNSLWQATKDYANKNYAAAKADLAGASGWLDKATRSTDKTTRNEASKLKSQVESLKGKVSKAGKDTGSDLKNLWDRSKALAEREAEKVSNGWSKSRGKSSAKADLINAKLHLSYAESARFVHGKSAEVSNEIDQVQGYLDNAAKTSDKALTAKIHAMSAEVKQLKSSMDDKGGKAHARYDKVKADLRQTIKDL